MRPRDVRERVLVIRSFIPSSRRSFTGIRCVPGPELGGVEQEFSTLWPPGAESPLGRPVWARASLVSAGPPGRLACVNVL